MKNNIYLALLRGINVGGNNTVSMKNLKKVFEGLGYTNIKTYINSGNVIFQTTDKSSDKIVRVIEDAIEKEFGFAVRVLLRSKKQIEEVCELIPKKWTNSKTMRTDVIFLWKEADNVEEVAKVVINPQVDNLIYKAGAIIWNFEREKCKESKSDKFIGTYLYKHMTARNVNTTRKLLELMREI